MSGSALHAGLPCRRAAGCEKHRGPALVPPYLQIPGQSCRGGSSDTIFHCLGFLGSRICPSHSLRVPQCAQLRCRRAASRSSSSTARQSRRSPAPTGRNTVSRPVFAMTGRRMPGRSHGLVADRVSSHYGRVHEGCGRLRRKPETFRHSQGNQDRGAPRIGRKIRGPTSLAAAYAQGHGAQAGV